MSKLYIFSFYKNWWLKLANHRGIKDKVILMRLRNGLNFFIRSNTDDDGVLEELFIKEPYTKQAGFKIKQGDIVFDVGAHIGVFSIYAANKGAKVYSYEPSSINRITFYANVYGRTNRLHHKPTMNECAVASKRGVKKLYVSTGSGSHTLYDIPINLKGSMDVTTTTLDYEMKKYKLDHIDLLKLDCEGAEYDIIYTCKNLHNIKKIAMEWHPIKGESILELGDFLARKGFKVTTNQHHKNYLYAERIE